MRQSRLWMQLSSIRTRPSVRGRDSWGLQPACSPSGRWTSWPNWVTCLLQRPKRCSASTLTRSVTSKCCWWLCIIYCPHPWRLLHRGVYARWRMLTGIIPAGGVSARGGTQAPACLGWAGNAAGRAAEAGAVAGKRPGSHTARHGPSAHPAAEGARKEHAAVTAAVPRCNSKLTNTRQLDSPCLICL